MHRVLFLFLGLLNLLLLNHAVEYDGSNFENNRPYNLPATFNVVQTSLVLKNKPPIFINSPQLNRIDSSYVLEIAELLLQNSSKCLRDIFYTFESITNLSNPWAIKLLDSFGKPESGIFQGNLKWIGDYKECLAVYAPPKAPGSSIGNFHGQYCTIPWILPLPNMSFPLTIGLCIPDSCSPQQLHEDVLQLYSIAGLFPTLDEDSFVNITNNNNNNNVNLLTCVPRDRHLNAPAKAVIALLSIFCALSLLGSSITAVNYFKKMINESKEPSLILNISDTEQIIGDSKGVPSKNVESDDKSLLQDGASEGERKGFLANLEKFLSCFCMFTNGAKLLNTDSSEGQLLCIHGIRFLSMSWVILGHAYITCYTSARNLLDAVTLFDNFLFEVVLQGFYSVDSFFVLSGFLLAYLSLKEFSKRKGSISWVYFYIHRYLRLTPIYMIVLGFSASLYFYLGSGPLWPAGDYDPICRKNWWWNLLYINNFNKQNEQCMGWSWYLANDMQFFVISPIFLIPLWRWPKIGCSLLALFLLASMLSNFFITYHFDLLAGLISLGSMRNLSSIEAMLKALEYFDKIYIKPYTRIGPYLVGIFTGYLLFKNKTNNKSKLSWVTLCIGWIVASAVTLTCVYGLYHKNPSLVARSFYNALSRTCFAAGLSWVIYVCLTNQGGFVNSILSYKLFIPLSRLTYSAYLIHPMIIGGYYASLTTMFQFSHPSVVTLYLGFMLLTYALSLPVSLVLESPLVSLEKWIRNSFNKEQKTESRS